VFIAWYLYLQTIENLHILCPAYETGLCKTC